MLRGHCDAEGRDYDAIEKTVLVGFDAAGDLDGFLAEMAGYAEAGFDLVSTGPTGGDPVAWTTTVVEDVVPRLAEL